MEDNIKHARGQAPYKAPKAAGQALGRTAKEFRENKELREKTAMALGAGALPIALASDLATAEYIPAMLSRAALSLGGDKALSLLWALTDSRASQTVQDAIVGYLPGTPVISEGGAAGMFYNLYGDDLRSILSPNGGSRVSKETK